MIVIIEGLDGVGKTTIAKRLAEKLNYNYVHESYSDDVEEKIERLQLLQKRIEQNENYIYDRVTVIDDIVYDFLNSEPSVLNVYKLDIIEALSKCKVFHLEIDEQVRKERFEKRGDEYITNDMIKLIEYRYNDFYESIKNVEKVTLSLDNEQNVDELIRRIKND